ncbi:MAG: HAMP domain-containing protein [Rhodobacteraceae bacterium]|nr:MAG: HAMP domain-containing protein [Paracoccaceae bacterium]
MRDTLDHHPAPEAESPPRRRWRLSPGASLMRRIAFINALGLGLLVGGVLYLNQFREGLIDLRAEALRTQGEIIAIAVAEAAGTRGDMLGFDPVRANLVLRRLAQPAGVRARIFDRSGRLTGDTRSFGAAAAPIEATPLPPPNGGRPRIEWLGWLESRYDALVGLLSPRPETYRETPFAGVSTEAEVYAALKGEPATAVRMNSGGELIVSVAIPIQRFKAVFGALVLSTEGGDIDAIVRAERIAILRVFFVALAVSVFLSALLAAGIARPLRRLAEAARRSGALGRGPIDPSRIDFPDLTHRADEIGRLSGALRRMTAALYGRIDAIERFAADVAHEIKNPLTSLRSAVETLRRARTPEMQEKLLLVIEHDVRRLDRLVTDISNASRLDAELVREAMAPVDLVRLAEAVSGVSEGRAEARRARVVVSAEEPEIWVQGLESRLGQVIRNLVDNALSFSPPGGTVTIRVGRAADGAATVDVEDEGPGVPEDKLEAIFERFWTERPETESFGDHSGLGLSISRQIVEAHGGALNAGNIGRPPRGARFTARFPP